MQLTNQAAAFPKALRSFLRGKEDDEIFRAEMLELLGPEEYTYDSFLNARTQTVLLDHLERQQ